MTEIVWRQRFNWIGRTEQFKMNIVSYFNDRERLPRFPAASDTATEILMEQEVLSRWPLVKDAEHTPQK